MKHTPLFDRHAREAATVINLKGTARAMHYGGHVAEHRATREAVSLCDVSHMGELDFKGRDALALMQKIITNDAAKLAVNQALYSAMCADDGMVIGPTPPGTGVMYEAFSRTPSKSTSPTSRPSGSRLMPTSITTAPVRTI